MSPRAISRRRHCDLIEFLEPRVCLSAPFTPAPGSPIAVGRQPGQTAVGDFNGDHIPDLAVANGADNTVTILLGNGSGGFTAAPGSPIAVGDAPVSVAVGDFNGDGKEDLAIANASDNTVTILLGSGNGAFTPASGSPITVGAEPAEITVGDFTRNGKLDLAVTNFMNGIVSILLGNGDGTFANAAGSPIVVGTSPYGVVAADFNGDGIPDLAVADTGDNRVSVLLGNGDGTFTNATGSPISVGAAPYSLAVGDFNGDHIQDLAVANDSDSSVSILLGNGDGTFHLAGNPIKAGINPYSIAVGDFNGDGEDDFVIANLYSNTVNVFLGNGDGTFDAALGSPYAVGTNPDAVTAADLTGDGLPDLIVSDSSSNNISVLLNHFTPEAPLPTGTLGAGVTASLPRSIVSGLKENASAIVTVTAPAGSPVNGLVKVVLYASPSATVSNATQLLSFKENLKIKAGASKALRLKLPSFPSRLQGVYHLIAAVVAPDGTTTAVAGPTLTTQPPYVTVVTSNLNAAPSTVAPGGKVNLSLSLENEGNVAVSRKAVLTFSFFASDASLQTIASPSLKVTLKPGQSRVYNLRIVVPKGTGADTYFLSSTLDVSSLGDTVATDGNAEDLNQITVS